MLVVLILNDETGIICNGCLETIVIDQILKVQMGKLRWLHMQLDLSSWLLNWLSHRNSIGMRGESWSLASTDSTPASLVQVMSKTHLGA